MPLLEHIRSAARILMPTACLLAITVALPLSAAPDANRYLTPEAVSVEKSAPVLSTEARNFLADRDGDTAVVWVFFTDKGFEDRSQYQQRAAAVNIPGKALQRRAKTNTDRVLFVDLPVHQPYVDEVVATGAQLRRTSKWLNSMSAEVPREQLDAIAALPFVAEIRPLAIYSRDNVDFSPARPEFVPDASAQPDALNYGSSFNALSMIGAPAAHEQGLHGEGVTICIMDTGFRKSHEAFAKHIADGRFLDEYDFVFNDDNTANEVGEDWASAWNHGTLIWGAVGGEVAGTLYGPAFRANFLLAKTEDVRSETVVEEDNWIAALEWADSLGADVTTTSLTYSNWYTSSDYDGLTAPITLAANTAASLGIIACNAMGNRGPGTMTLGAPADAFDIIAVGAVDAAQRIAGFSSRGPTSDGRTKPELMAQGVGTFTSTSGNDAAYGTANGTSLSTPLVAGAAALMVQARPTWPPTLIRQALLETASRADNPDNDFGWGIVNIAEALEWGSNFTADTAFGEGSLTVQFTNTSELPFTSMLWDFGDGATSTSFQPTHTFTEPGGYTVSLTIDTEYGPITQTKEHFVVVLGDTLQFVSDSAFAGESMAISVTLDNSQPLETFMVPFAWGGDPRFEFDSVALGNRTTGAILTTLVVDRTTPIVVPQVSYLSGNTLTAGSGEVLRLYFSTPEYVDGYSGWVDTTSKNQYILKTAAPYLTYTPDVVSAAMHVIAVDHGDLNHDGTVNPVDIAYLVDFLYSSGSEPVSTKASDVNRDFVTNGTDLSYLVDYVFNGGPAPPS